MNEIHISFNNPQRDEIISYLMNLEPRAWYWTFPHKYITFNDIELEIIFKLKFGLTNV